jgi:hypothetical protein
MRRREKLENARQSSVDFGGRRSSMTAYGGDPVAKRCLVPIVLFLLTCSSFAQTEPERQTRRRAPDAPAPKAAIADMAWLAGRWTGDGLGGRVEEIWSPPDAGTMMGTFRLIRDEKVMFYEFLTLRVTEQGLTMQLKHFNLDMSGWEEKNDFVEFLYVGKEETAITSTVWPSSATAMTRSRSTSPFAARTAQFASSPS